MQIVGKWHTCDDSIVRPVVETTVLSATGQPVLEAFLVDSCADCTVLSADLLSKLNLPGKSPSPNLSLKGISGAGNYVVVTRLSNSSAPTAARRAFAARWLPLPIRR